MWIHNSDIKWIKPKNWHNVKKQSTTERRAYVINMNNINQDPNSILDYIKSVEQHFNIKYANCTDGIILPTNNIKQMNKLNGINPKQQNNWDNSHLKNIIKDYDTAIDRIDRYRAYCGISIQCKYNEGILKVFVEQIKDTTRQLSTDELIERAKEMIDSFVFNNEPIAITYICPTSNSVFSQKR